MIHCNDDPLKDNYHNDTKSELNPHLPGEENQMLATQTVETLSISINNRCQFVPMISNSNNSSNNAKNPPLYTERCDEEFDQASSSGCSSNNSYSGSEDNRSQLQPIGCTDVMPTGWHRHPHFNENDNNKLKHSTKLDDNHRTIALGSRGYKKENFKSTGGHVMFKSPGKNKEQSYYTLHNFRNYQKQQEQNFNFPSFQPDNIHAICNNDSASTNENKSVFHNVNESVRLYEDQNLEQNVNNNVYASLKDDLIEYTTNHTHGIKNVDANKTSHCKDSNKKNKQYNSSIIGRSASCVNSKLEAMSQRILLKGKENNHHKSRQKPIFFPTNEMSTNYSNKNNSELNLSSQFLQNHRNSDSQSTKRYNNSKYNRSNGPIKETNEEFENRTNQFIEPNDLVSNSQGNLLKSSDITSLAHTSNSIDTANTSSRLLRRRHTTYIKDQDTMKLSSNVMKNEEQNYYKTKLTNDRFCSASLNRAFLRTSANMTTCQNGYDCELHRTVDDHNNLNHVHSWHRIHGINDSSIIPINNTHHRLKKVRDI